MIKQNLLNELEQVSACYDKYLATPAQMNTHALYGAAIRDGTHPPWVDLPESLHARAVHEKWFMTHEELIKQAPESFTTLGGITLHKTELGYLNPDAPTGLTGPGILGFGHDDSDNLIPENRAVDVMIGWIDPEDQKFKFVGGIRGDTGQPCFAGGFQEKSALATAVREFIEECISGSLDPQALGLDAASLGDNTGEAIYHVITERDPVFVQDLTRYFREKLKVVYQGPCRADPRNTDHRWMATTLISGIVAPNELETLMQNRVFPYRLAAGSDLASVKIHEFGPDFVTRAYASHGPLACTAVAHLFRPWPHFTPQLAQQCQETIEAMRAVMQTPRTGLTPAAQQGAPPLPQPC